MVRLSVSTDRDHDDRKIPDDQPSVPIVDPAHQARPPGEHANSPDSNCQTFWSSNAQYRRTAVNELGDKRTRLTCPHAKAKQRRDEVEKLQVDEDLEHQHFKSNGRHTVRCDRSARWECHWANSSLHPSTLTATNHSTKTAGTGYARRKMRAIRRTITAVRARNQWTMVELTDMTPLQFAQTKAKTELNPLKVLTLPQCGQNSVQDPPAMRLRIEAASERSTIARTRPHSLQVSAIAPAPFDGHDNAATLGVTILEVRRENRIGVPCPPLYSAAGRSSSSIVVCGNRQVAFDTRVCARAFQRLQSAV